MILDFNSISRYKGDFLFYNSVSHVWSPLEHNYVQRIHVLASGKLIGIEIIGISGENVVTS